jgi:hypothetical protein
MALFLTDLRSKLDCRTVERSVTATTEPSLEDDEKPKLKEGKNAFPFCVQAAVVVEGDDTRSIVPPFLLKNTGRPKITTV